MNNLRKRLEDHAKTLPEAPSPIPSPSMDAPSPGSTPPQNSLGDNTEAIDMEMSDEEDNLGTNIPGKKRVDD